MQIVDVKEKTKAPGENPNTWKYWLLTLQDMDSQKKLWDKIQFTDLIKWGHQRAKLQLHRLGYPKDADFEMEPQDLIGKKVYIKVKVKGDQNEVLFDGYRMYGGEPEDNNKTEEVPF